MTRKQSEPATFRPFGGATIILRDDDMRRRGNQQGHLYIENGLWKLRYRVDDVDANGKTTRRLARPFIIGRAEGAGRIARKAAQRIQADHMATVNRHSGPMSRITVGEFIERRFLPDHVAGLTTNGRRHYTDVLKHVRAAFKDWEISEVKVHHVKTLLNSKASAGYSAHFITHIRNALTRLYRHAEECGLFEGRNPAARLEIPRSAREPEPTQPYTIDELRAILAALDSPLREMFLLGAATSMHAAELAGLRIEHVNLGDKPRAVRDRFVPPGALYSCESWSNHSRTSGKTKNRRRILPIPAALHEPLRRLIADRPPSEPVFVMPRTVAIHGKALPIATNNVSARTLRPLGKRLGIRVCWHRLRATNATLTGQMLLDPEARVAMMGHWSETMTAKYEDPFDRQRQAAEAIATKLQESGPTSHSVQ